MGNSVATLPWHRHTWADMTCTHFPHPGVTLSKIPQWVCFWCTAYPLSCPLSPLLRSMIDGVRDAVGAQPKGNYFIQEIKLWSSLLQRRQGTMTHWHKALENHNLSQKGTSTVVQFRLQSSPGNQPQVSSWWGHIHTRLSSLTPLSWGHSLNTSHSEQSLSPTLLLGNLTWHSWV